MSWNKFLSMVNPECIKTNFGLDEYDRISKDSKLYNSTYVYNVYLFNVKEDRLTYVEFYKHLRDTFYYDKYICYHGDEFMYYIKFNKDVPSTNRLNDVLYIRKPVHTHKHKKGV